MKRLIAAAILLAVTILAAFISNYAVKKICLKTDEKLEEYMEKIDIESYSQAEDDADDLKSYWQKKEPVMALFVNHKFLDDISIAINRIADHSAEENLILIKSTCSDIKFTLKQIISEQELSIESLY